MIDQKIVRDALYRGLGGLVAAGIPPHRIDQAVAQIVHELNEAEPSPKGRRPGNLIRHLNLIAAELEEDSAKWIRSAIKRIERKTQTVDALAAEIHEAWEFQYDECDHGTYMGGVMNGEPYEMCRISAERIVQRRRNKAQSQVEEP